MNDKGKENESLNLRVTSHVDIALEHADFALDGIRQQDALSVEQPVYGDDECSGGEKGKRQVKRRKRTSVRQFAVLNRTFSENPKPSAQVRRVLAQTLDMSNRGVQVWFQNRRAKMKRGGPKRDKEPSQKVKPSNRPKPVIMAACTCPPAPLHHLLPAGEAKEIKRILPNIPRSFPIAQRKLSSAEIDAGMPLSPPMMLCDQTPEYFAVQTDPSGFVPPDPDLPLDYYNCVTNQQPPYLPPPILPSSLTPPYFPLGNDFPDYASSLISFVEESESNMVPPADTHGLIDGPQAGAADFFGFPDALGIYARGFGEDVGLDYALSGHGNFLLPSLGLT